MKDDDRTPIWLKGPGNLYKVHVEMTDQGLGGYQGEALPSIGRALLADDDPELRDRGRSILWVAASLGSSEACAELSRQVLAYLHENTLPPDEEDRLARLVTDWRVLSTMKAAEPLVPVSPLHAARAAAGKRRRFEAAATSSEFADEGIGAEETEIEPSSSRSGVVIVRSIGDPGTTDGKNIAARYAHVIGRSLPFSGSTPARGHVASVIEAEFPWAENVARDLERRIEVSAALGGGRRAIRPLLLLGPSGSGKTSLAVRLAELFGRRLTIVSAGGTTDSAGVGAVTRGWSGARPCGPFLAAAEAGCCDPAILIDEIDKSPREGSQNGSVSGTLHGMLNFGRPFQDACLMADVDLSNMMFMATANSLDRIPGSLIDRFDVMIVKRPELEHFPTVLSMMRKAVALESKTSVDLIPALDAEETNALYDFFKRDRCSLRSFEKAFSVMLSEAAVRERAMPH